MGQWLQVSIRRSKVKVCRDQGGKRKRKFFGRTKDNSRTRKGIKGWQFLCKGSKEEVEKKVGTGYRDFDKQSNLTSIKWALSLPFSHAAFTR
jgi:hypothetical protein